MIIARVIEATFCDHTYNIFTNLRAVAYPVGRRGAQGQCPSLHFYFKGLYSLFIRIHEHCLYGKINGKTIDKIVQ